MDEKDFNKLQNDLDVANMFIRAAEEVKQLNAEREKGTTESECRKALETIKSCIKGKEENCDKA